MDKKEYNFGEFIEFSIQKRFALIRLNRIKRANALTLEMLQDLKKAIVYCQESDKIRGLILTGNGNTFTTGMDLAFIDASNHSEVLAYEKVAADIANLMYSGKPIVCAINGRAMGDGVAYALCSDYRITVKDSFFLMPEIKSGIFPGAATIVLMTKILGISWTKKILIFAEKIDSQTALEIGLVDQIVDYDDLIELALRKAKFLSTKNQIVLNGIKLCSNYLLDKSYIAAHKLEKEFLTAWVKSKDKPQFLNEFREKIINL